MNYKDRLQALLDEAQALLNELDILTVCDDDGMKNHATSTQTYLHGKTMGLKMALKYLEDNNELQR